MRSGSQKLNFLDQYPDPQPFIHGLYKKLIIPDPNISVMKIVLFLNETVSDTDPTASRIRIRIRVAND